METKNIISYRNGNRVNWITDEKKRCYSVGMLSNISTKIKNAMDALTRKKILTKNDVNAAMNNVRLALIQSDVAQEVVDEFVAKLKDEIVGEKVVEQFPKAATVYALVQKHLTELLGQEQSDLLLFSKEKETKEKGRISIILVAGVQGSGKTTTCAKLAQYIRTSKRMLNTSSESKFLLVSLDTHRPAAQEQLARLAQQVNVLSLPVSPEEKNPVNIVRNTWKYLENDLLVSDARKDWIIIMDTAGRMQVDQEMMEEIKNVENEIRNYIRSFSNEKYEIQPSLETLLVADAMLGNEAVNIAKQFHDQLGLSGIVLTRLDGDARGGAAISMRAKTGVPIKLIGIGENLNALDVFDPVGLANRIMGQGDVGSLARRVMAATAGDSRFDMNKYTENMSKYSKGVFNLADYLQFAEVLKKIGGVAGMASALPGDMGKKVQQYSGILERLFGDKAFEKHSALISHLTEDEILQPQIIKTSSSRRIRIAKDAGVEPIEVNQMLKMYDRFKVLFEKLGKSGIDMKSLQSNDPSVLKKLTEVMMSDPELLRALK
jgi:signal recognition particle subunit SRP54